MKLLAFILLVSLYFPVNADSIDDALAIVIDNSATISEKTIDLDIARNGHDWASEVRFGYNYKQNDSITASADTDGNINTDSKGLNGQLTLKIPLFSNEQNSKISKAHAAAAVEREKVVVSFLSVVKQLILLNQQWKSADENYKLKQDKLEYYKRSLKEGLLESPAELWVHAEASKAAEHAAAEKMVEYKTELDIVSRQFGGAQWRPLKTHLIAHVNSTNK